jgi:hypothetical protein
LYHHLAPHWTRRLLSVDPQPDPRAPGASPAPSLGVPCSENTGDPTAPPCRLLDRPASTPHTSLRYCAARSSAHCWVAHSWVAHSWGAHCWVAHCWGAPCACLWHDRLGITHASLPAAGRIASNHAKLPLSSLPLRSSSGRLPCSLAPIFFGAKLCSSCALVRALGIARLTARNPSSPSSLTHASIHLPTPLACQPDGFVVSLQETARHAPRHRTHSHRTQGYRAPSERAPAPASHRAPN